jgi:hypothetical protein
MTWPACCGLDRSHLIWPIRTVPPQARPGYLHPARVGLAEAGDPNSISITLRRRRRRRRDTPGRTVTTVATSTSSSCSIHLAPTPPGSSPPLFFELQILVETSHYPFVCTPKIWILNLCGFHTRRFYGGPRDMPEKGGVFACGPCVGPFCKSISTAPPQNAMQ